MANQATPSPSASTRAPDRVLRTLLNGAPNPGWAAPVFGDGAAGRAALVLRVVRDDMALAALSGQLPAHPEVESYLNTRIEQLASSPTLTGDTTLRPTADAVTG